VDVVIRKRGEKVGKDGKKNGCAAEFDGPDEPLKGLEGEACTFPHAGQIRLLFIKDGLVLDAFCQFVGIESALKPSLLDAGLAGRRLDMVEMCYGRIVRLYGQ
jgi:hypothetical protein